MQNGTLKISQVVAEGARLIGRTAVEYDIAIGRVVNTGIIKTVSKTGKVLGVLWNGTTTDHVARLHWSEMWGSYTDGRFARVFMRDEPAAVAPEPIKMDAPCIRPVSEMTAEQFASLESHEQRQCVEREIVRRVVRAMLGAGYLLGVDSGGDEPDLYRCADEAQIMEAAFAVDDCRLMVQHSDPKAVKENCGWVRFVFGNSGYDVLSNYTVNHETLLKPINEYADTLVGG